MFTISEIMAENHRECDELFSRAKAFITGGDWEHGRTTFDLLTHAMKLHLSMEEDVLFPSLEKRTAQAAEWTGMLRTEHEQIRHLLSDMEEAVAEENRDQYRGFAETLLVTLEQHSKIEEQILYPLSDRELGSDAAEIVQRMKSI